MVKLQILIERMKEKIRKVPKMRISTYRHNAVKRGRIHRFAKWTEDIYGVPFRTMYNKLRKNRVKIWEGAGIIRCMDEYGFHGTPGELWTKCTRNRFVEFMKRKQMSRMTIWQRFGADDFTDLEMQGISAAYRQWRENVDSKN